MQHPVNPLETAVKTSADRLNELRASLDRLAAVVAPVKFGDHAAIAAEQVRIGDLQAAEALGESVGDELKAARARLDKLQAEAQEVDAAAASAAEMNAGLARRRASVIDEISRAEAAHQEAEVALLRSMLEPAEVAFLEAAQRAAEALRHFYGIHSALWERGVRPSNFVTCAAPLQIPICGPVTLQARERGNSGMGDPMATVGHPVMGFGRGSAPIEEMLTTLASTEVA